MKILPYKTKAVEAGDDLFAILKSSIMSLEEKSVLCISSKIIALCQGDVCPADADKMQLIKEECEWYLPPETNKFGSTITITGHKLAAAAGIDESNAHGTLVLLPSHILQTATSVHKWLMQTYGVKNVGVVIIDSRSTPLNLGTTGQALTAVGIQPLKDYRGKVDIFGREIVVSRLNIVNCLASAAVLAMGEGDERLPIATIEQLDQVEFSQDYQGDALDYEIDNDLYAALLKSDLWQPGGGGYMRRQ